MVQHSSTAVRLSAGRFPRRCNVFKPRGAQPFSFMPISSHLGVSLVYFLLKSEGDHLLLCTASSSSASSTSASAPPSNLYCLSSSSFTLRGQLEGHKVRSPPLHPSERNRFVFTRHHILLWHSNTVRMRPSSPSSRCTSCPAISCFRLIYLRSSHPPPRAYRHCCRRQPYVDVSSGVQE